jgi:hypothetical protein
MAGIVSIVVALVAAVAGGLVAPAGFVVGTT